MEALASIIEECEKEIKDISNLSDLEAVRVKYLGKKGLVSEKMRDLGKLPPEERKEFGQSLNKVKQSITSSIELNKSQLEQAELNKKLVEEHIDITIPPRPEKCGGVHPISQVIDEMTTILQSMGFDVVDGPEIEDDFHNFTALNIPPNHPARQMQDTFYVQDQEDNEPKVLRTHTSSVQIRTMQNNKPPFKVVAPGRVYRSDYDMTHTPMFHQIEGLYIDKDIHMGHLKGCLQQLLEEFFEVKELPMRFRPSFFPFTEPSAEVDIGCKRSKGELTIGAGDSWLEILGCGMVHPNVLHNVGVNPNEYQGFAFGLGIERLAMLKYGVPDLRNFFESDARWLRHYNFTPLTIPQMLGVK